MLAPVISSPDSLCAMFAEGILNVSPTSRKVYSRNLKPFLNWAKETGRTIGDMSCTGAVDSPASTLAEIIAEVASSRVTERGSRMDDKRSEAAMEDRKKEGYF